MLVKVFSGKYFVINGLDTWFKGAWDAKKLEERKASWAGEFQELMHRFANDDNPVVFSEFVHSQAQHWFGDQPGLCLPPPLS